LAAEKGISALVEKPMAASSQDCKAMIKAAEENNVKLMIGHIQRYFSSNRKAREIIRSGQLGRLVSITDTRNVYYFHDKRPGWFLDKEMSGGGIFINLGAHCLDKIKFVTDSKIKSIAGKASYYEERFNVGTHYFFTGGAVKVGSEGFLVSREDGPFERIELESDEDAFYLQLKDFTDSIKEDKEPEIPGEYGLEIIEAIEEVYRGI